MGKLLRCTSVGMYNAVAEEKCCGGLAGNVDVEVPEAFLGGFVAGVDGVLGEMADENVGGGSKLGADEVIVGEGGLGFGSGTASARDLFVNAAANRNDVAASGSLTESSGCKSGEMFGYEKNVLLNEDVEVGVDQRMGKDGAIDEIEVSGDGISLFVEFSGPAAENSGLHLSIRDDEDLEVKEENGECGRFFVGDVVWVKTKSQSWWPGKVVDPSDASPDTIEANRGRLLVAYLGSFHVSWCLTSQLKAFHKNFAEMLKQNKSRSFTGAVERAVHEFGQHLLEKLTSKREKDLNSVLVEFGEYSSVLFEPREFLPRLKFLAVNLTGPSVLDFVVMKNYLSAFYSSIGHENKPMPLLLLEADPDEIPIKCSAGWKKRSRKMKFDGGEIGTGGVEGIYVGSLTSSPSNIDRIIAGKRDEAFESRSRKKSKYLSYPYINCWNKELAYETEENIYSHDSRGAAFAGVSENGFVGSPALVKCTGKKFPWLQTQKFKSLPPDLSSFTPAEFLSEIGSLARDCLYTNGSDKFHKIDWFAYKLRSYLFQDQHSHEVYAKNACKQEGCSGNVSCPAAIMKPEKRRKREKRIPDTEVGNGKTKPLCGLSDLNAGFDVNGPLEGGLPDLNGGTVPGYPILALPKKRWKRSSGGDRRPRDATESAFDQQDSMANNNIKIASKTTEAMLSTYRGGRRRGGKSKSSEAAEDGMNGSPPDTAAEVSEAAEQGSLRLPDLNGQKGMNSTSTTLPKPKQRRGRRRRRRKEIACSKNQTRETADEGTPNAKQNMPLPSGLSARPAEAPPTRLHKAQPADDDEYSGEVRGQPLPGDEDQTRRFLHCSAITKRPALLANGGRRLGF